MAKRFAATSFVASLVSKRCPGLRSSTRLFWPAAKDAEDGELGDGIVQEFSESKSKKLFSKNETSFFFFLKKRPCFFENRCAA